MLSFVRMLLFSCSVVSNSLWPHGLQNTRIPCPSSSHRVYSNSRLLSRWCHPTISSSVVPFSSCLQSFPASGTFLMSQLFSSCGQSIGASASVSIFPMNIQGWFPLGLTGLISLQSKGLLRVFSSTIVQKHQFFGAQLSRPAWQAGFPKVQYGERMRNETQEFREKWGSGYQHCSKVKVPKLNPGQLYCTLSCEGKNVQGVKL